MSRNSKLIIIILLACYAHVHSQVPKVVATASMIADMARELGGDRIAVECIVPIGGDPHIYQPTPGDARMVHEADLILKNGLTFEGWLNELIENSGTEANVVTVTQGIKPIESQVYQNATDPHAWMDAFLAQTYIKNIKESLLSLDPEGRQYYQQKYDRYSHRLKELDQYITESIEKIPENQRILITSHDAFQYYGRRYGLRLESVLGTSTDAEIQTSDIFHLNKVIKETGVSAVFIESTINPKVLQQIASDNKIKIGGKLYSDSIGDEKSPGATYYDMLKHNTDVIFAALSAPPNYEDHTDSNAPLKTSYLYIFIGGLMLLLMMLLAIKFSR